MGLSVAMMIDEAMHHSDGVCLKGQSVDYDDYFSSDDNSKITITAPL